jgi:hypothetical protein
MNRENESGDILFDMLKTAEDLSKEADWKSKLLAPALGLGMALAPSAQAQQQQFDLHNNPIGRAQQQDAERREQRGRLREQRER